uniref:Retrotransposon protein, putative, Ty1-copia subclass n=1 Tax=Oryza sativa subsp. japonica TaxID=39947 RepID=Q7XEC4_ORYSJ|nr:retrotransposon protein, putative, Ty1-copia subclass [Oryza sativa Japonica Group]
MAATAVSKFEVVKFDGTGNFVLWQMRLKDLLAQQGISKALQETMPEKIDADKWNEMKAQAAATIRLSLSDSVMYQVMDEKSPKEIWDKLASLHMSKSLTSKLYLKQQLYGLQVQEESDLRKHVDVFNQLVVDLSKLDVKLDDEDKAIILLCSLPLSYEHVVTTLTHGKDTVKTEEIISSLLARDLRRSKKNEATKASQGKSLLVKDKHDHEAGVSKSKEKGARCYKCHEFGHIRRNCPLLKKRKGGIASLAARGDDSDSGSHEILTVSDEMSGEAWMLDSASSYHVTSKREWFSSYKSGDFGVVYLGDGTSYRVVGVGDVNFKICETRAGIKEEFVSLGSLHETGWLYQVDSDRKTMNIMKDGKTVMTGERTSSCLYKLQGSAVTGGVMEDGYVGVAVHDPEGGEPGVGSSGGSA